MPKYTDEECKALVIEHGYELRGDMVWTDCYRCGGSGRFACWGHIANGDCFLCAGRKGKLRPIRKVAASIRRRLATEANAPARAAAKRVLEAAKRAVKIAEARIFLALNPELHAALAGAGNDIRRDLASKLVQYGTLTTKQIAFALKLRDEAVVKTAEADTLVPVPVTDERVEIHARIVYTREECGFAYDSTVTKGLFVCDAGEGRTFKLWGTVPRALLSAERDDHVVFFAKITPKKDDPMFGYINRPTKAAIVAA